MAQVHPGRYTAKVDGEIVVFLIGMRFNNLLKVRSWLPVFTAMPRMLAALARDPDSGLLGTRSYFLPQPLVVQYWRSFEDLSSFARSPREPHLGAWRKFNRVVGASGAVGIWHETYRVPAGSLECIYSNMPVSGLAAATSHVPVRSGRQSAAARIGAAAADEPVLPPPAQ